jgi:signal transduction histidine kinase/CheY-like chemotaxis protein
MSKPRILVVEDEEDMSKVITINLRMEGMDTFEVRNVPSALARIEQAKPDCIVIDVMFQEDSGWDVLKRVKSNPALAAIPVVMLTATAGRHEGTREKGVEVVEYVNKTFSPPALTDAVKSVLKPGGLRLIKTEDARPGGHSAMSAVQAVSDIIASNGSYYEILDRLSDEFIASFDSAACAFIRSGEESEVYAFRKDKTGRKSVSKTLLPFGVEERLRQSLAPHRESGLISKLNGLRADDVLPGSKKEEECFAVPLFEDRSYLGAILMAFGQGHQLSRENVQLFLTLANLVSLAVARDRIYDNMRDSEIVHRRLVHQCITAQESERRRLAGEIHDGVVQSLVGISYRLQALEKRIPPSLNGRFRRDLKLLEDQLTCGISEIRSMLAGLRPPTLYGTSLFSSLDIYVKNFGIKNNMVASLLLPDKLPTLSRDAQINLFRIFQETLNNVEKHSHASEVNVEIDIGLKNFYLTIRDDGRGFRVQEKWGHAKHLGIASMRERTELLGGKFSIKSKPGQGTSVTLTIPLEQIAKEEDV